MVSNFKIKCIIDSCFIWYLLATLTVIEDGDNLYEGPRLGACGILEFVLEQLLWIWQIECIRLRVEVIEVH